MRLGKCQALVGQENRRDKLYAQRLRGRDGTCQAHLVLVAIRDYPAVKRDGFVCGVQERYEFCFWDRVLF